MNTATTIHTPHGDLFFTFDGEHVTMENPRTVTQYEKLLAAGMVYVERNRQIALQCDPQEIYFVEYNKNNCSRSWGGDGAAIEQVVAIFGEGVARNITRLSVY